MAVQTIQSVQPGQTVQTAKPSAVPTLTQWWAEAEHITISLPDPARRSSLINRAVAVHISGNGPWLTLLHGFPSSSWDWSRVIPHLTDRFRVLTFDLLGYGDSDKPQQHNYSTPEHADTVQAIWHHYGIKETSLVGHDIGGSISKELLARQLERKLGVTLNNVVFMNSAVYTDHYKPVLITRLMQNPVIGPIIVGRLTEKSLSKSVARIFSKAHPASPEDLQQTWQALQHNGGLSNITKLLHYIPESKRYHARWHNAIQTTKLPLRFIWGMEDPATGRLIAEDIRRYKPNDYFAGFEDVGHFPQLEAPERVAAELRRLV
jgi:pimeloyl-ACP methyl ester carboxylesterase